MTHPLIEAVARELWETWRTSPIVTEASKDVAWEDLGRWAETSIKMMVVRDTVYAEARAAVLATLRGLRDEAGTWVNDNALLLQSGGLGTRDVFAVERGMKRMINAAITEIGGPDAG